MSANTRPVPAHADRGRAAFDVTFASAMTDADLEWLPRVFDLATHTHPKRRPDPASPGVAALGHFWGLFLERLPARPAQTADHRAGEVLNRRPATLRRRPVGLR